MEQEIHGYRYFMVGRFPVKIHLNKRGQYMDAHVPDRDTRGLKRDLKYIDFVMDGQYVTEIDEDQYDTEVEDFLNREPKRF